MTNTTINKIMLSATTAMFLTACGSSGGGSSTSASDTASAKIQAYALDGSKAEPTVADYAAVGVTVTDLAGMNALVDAKTKASEVDEKSELEALLASLNPTTSGNKAPKANAGADQTVKVGATVTLDGSKSKDTDGTIASYQWKKGSASLGNTKVVTYTAAKKGTDTITLTVTDDDGVTAKDTVKVTVTAVTVTPPSTTKGFEDHNTTVKDLSTGLEWQKTVLSTCPTDYRVPKLAELQTILDYNQAGAPFVADLNISFYGDTYSTRDGWELNRDGAIGENNTITTNTLCVHGNYTPPARKTVKVIDDTVVDNNTNLIWNKTLPTQDTNGTLYTDAKGKCVTGYRLPTIVELESIYDRDNNTTIIPELNHVGLFWTSTKGANYPTMNWTVQIDDAAKYYGAYNSHNENGTDKAFVRCVKQKTN